MTDYPDVIAMLELDLAQLRKKISSTEDERDKAVDLADRQIEAFTERARQAENAIHVLKVTAEHEPT